MGMAEGRVSEEKHIHGMYRRTRTGRRERAIAVCVASLMLAACMMTACQPTPETAPIVGKGGDDLEEMIASSAQSTPPATAGQTESLMEAVGAPETFNDSYTNDKGDVTVTIDAMVEMPSVEALPAIQVKLCGFPQEQVDKLGEYFLKDAEIYAEDQVLIKEEVLQMILEEQQWLEMTKNESYGNREAYIEDSENRIEELQELYREAPEQRERTRSTLQLISDENGIHLSVLADLGKDAKATFAIYITDTYSYFEFTNAGKGFYDSNMESVTDGSPRGMSTSLEDAESIVMQCLADLGVGDMQIESVEVSTFFTDTDDYSDDAYIAAAKQCYTFSLARTVMGIPIHTIEGSTRADTDDPNVPAPEEPDYNLVSEPERLEISVDDTGIVGFEWVNPLEEIAVLSEHVTLLPFEKIVQRAKDNMFYKNYTAYGSTATIEITAIKLGMMRITRKDSPGEYLLMPVWDFMGNQMTCVEGYEDWLPFGDQSYVTINAIDGSNIHREWGY